MLKKRYAKKRYAKKNGLAPGRMGRGAVDGWVGGRRRALALALVPVPALARCLPPTHQPRPCPCVQEPNRFFSIPSF